MRAQQRRGIPQGQFQLQILPMRLDRLQADPQLHADLKGCGRHPAIERPAVSDRSVLPDQAFGTRRQGKYSAGTGPPWGAEAHLQWKLRAHPCVGPEGWVSHPPLENGRSSRGFLPEVRWTAELPMIAPTAPLGSHSGYPPTRHPTIPPAPLAYSQIRFRLSESCARRRIFSARR